MTITGKLDPSRLAFFSRPKTDTEAKIKISINGKDESLRVWCTTRGDASRRSNAIKLKDEISAASDVPQRDVSISQSKDLISSVLDLCEISQINDTKTGVVRFEEKGLTPEEKAKRAPRSIDGERARAIFHPDLTKSEQVEQHHEFLEKFMKGMNESATNGALQKINEKYPQLLEQKREGAADWVSKEGSPEYKAFEAYRNEVENIFFGAIGLEPLAPPPPLKDPVSPISVDPKISIDPINAELTHFELEPIEITPITTPSLTTTEIPTIKFDPPPPPNLIQREEQIKTPPPPPPSGMEIHSSSINTSTKTTEEIHHHHHHHHHHVSGSSSINDSGGDNNTKVDNDVKTTTIAKFEGPRVSLREKGLVDNTGNRLRDLAKNPAFKESIGDSIEDFAKNNVAGYSGLLPHQQRRIQRAIAATIMSIERSSNPPGVNLDDLNPQALKTTLLVSASRAKDMDKLGSVQISNHPSEKGQEHCTGFIRNIYADFIKAFPDNKEAATGAGKLLEECMSKVGFNAEEANALHEKLNKSGQEVLKYAEGDDMMDILKSMRDTLREDDDPKLQKLGRQLADEIDKRFQLQRDDDMSKLIASLPLSKRPKVDKAFKKLKIALDRNYSQRSIDKLFQKVDFMIEQKTKTNNNDALGASDEFMRTATQSLRGFVDQINEQLPATSADPGIQQLRAKILKPITQHVRKNIEVMEQRVAAFKNCQKDSSELVSTYSQKELPKGKNLGQQQYMGDFLSKAKYDTHITAYTSLGKSVNRFDNDFRLLNNLPEMTRDLESTQKLAEEGSQLAKGGPTLAKETPQKFSSAIRNIMHRAKPSEGEGQLSLGDTLNKLDPSLKDTAITILKQDAAHNPHPELTEKALEFAYSADRKALGEYCNKIGDEQADQLLETIAYLESGKNEVSSEEIQQGKQDIWISTLKQDENNPHPELTEKALEVLYDTTAAKSEEKYEGKDVYLGAVFEQYKKDHTDGQKAVDDLMETIAYLSKGKNKA